MRLALASTLCCSTYTAEFFSTGIPMQPFDVDGGPQQLPPFDSAIPSQQLQELPIEPFVFAASGAEGRAENSTEGAASGALASHLLLIRISSYSLVARPVIIHSSIYLCGA